MRNALNRDVRFNKTNLIIINSELRVATEIAQLIHGIMFHHDEPFLSESEISWLNSDVKDFFEKVSEGHFACYLLSDYLRYILSIAPEEQVRNVDTFVLECIQRNV